MTPQEINIAIAEELGWRFFQVGPEECEWLVPVDASKPTGERMMKRHVQMPNYHGSLDAMHEAENALAINGQRGEYARALSKIITGVDDFIQWPAVMATAPQRAEAFLRTLGKWKESTS